MKKTRMFEKLEGVLNKFRHFPIPVFLIVSTLLNYLLGDNQHRFTNLFSKVANCEKRTDFVIAFFNLVIAWFFIRVTNEIVGKVEKHAMLDSNYMKWIERLTRAKLSSISTVTTGVLNNAINSIAGCDKRMVDNLMSIIPNLIPFIMLCKKECDCAGIVPVVINILAIILFIGYGILASTFMSYKRQEEARADISGVTIDCIKNSQTVKYFNKEDWSINRQDAAQARIFGKFLAIPAIVSNTIFGLFMWTPTIVGMYMCWEDMSTVLYISMMSYVIENIGCYINAFFSAYTEKKNQLEVLGKLEKDDTIKNSIVDKIDINNVEFCYDPENEKAVRFKIDNLIIQKGHRYCVTGKSGFGKSTLAKLITGTYPPTKGTVPSVESVYMFAESEMFNMSIFENITLGEDADHVEIEDMLKAFEVSVDLDVYTDSVGENGNKLSTGQKQRINLCRTLFYARRHPGSLLVMDEVTAALDIKTSLTCLEYLTSEFKRLGVTLVYISNKTDYLETDLITDDIYVHRDGNVVTYCQKREIPENVPLLLKK